MRIYTRASVLVLPLFITSVLNTCGIFGLTSCIVSLIGLAIYTFFVATGEKYYNQHFKQ